jgi:hypothetical protein
MNSVLYSISGTAASGDRNKPQIRCGCDKNITPVLQINSSFIYYFFIQYIEKSKLQRKKREALVGRHIYRLLVQ